MPPLALLPETWDRTPQEGTVIITSECRRNLNAVSERGKARKRYRRADRAGGPMLRGALLVSGKVFRAKAESQAPSILWDSLGSLRAGC